MVSEDLLLHPHGNGLEKGRKAAGRVGNVAFQQPFEFQEGLVVKCHVIKLFGLDAPLSKAVFNGLVGKAEIMFLS